MTQSSTFDEIKARMTAAFAAGVPAPTSPPPTMPAFTPSPFGAPPAAVQPPTFTPAAPIVQPPPPVQAAFTFTPPAGFNPASAPPINPPGERAALAAPTPVPLPNLPPVDPGPVIIGTTAAGAPVVSQTLVDPTAEPTLAERTAQAGFSPPAGPAEPKRRGRKAKPSTEAQTYADASAPSLAADGAAIAQMPPDGSSVEDIVSELFARGVSSVHLTFTKDGK